MPKTKRCSKCRETKPIEEFWRNRAAKDGINGYCKTCCRAYRKATNFPVSVATHKCSRCKQTKPAIEFHRNRLSTSGLHTWCKVCSNLQAVIRNYGLSPEDYQQLRNEQDDQCAICGDFFVSTPHVDHCHTTGEVRGLLCRSCNSLLGHAKDSPNILKKAIRYLTEGVKK